MCLIPSKCVLFPNFMKGLLYVGRNTDKKNMGVFIDPIVLFKMY